MPKLPVKWAFRLKIAALPDIAAHWTLPRRNLALPVEPGLRPPEATGGRAAQSTKPNTIDNRKLGAMTENAQSTEAATFDLEALKARCLNNMSLVERVLTKFAGQVDADLAALEEAVAAGNAPDVAKLSHRIKGMTASIEARSMCENAARCERTALAAAVDELPNLLNELRQDRDRLFAAISSCHKSISA
jgi:HPt (histidine-containing phosphotransfer) domain-containing protein